MPGEKPWKKRSDELAQALTATTTPKRIETKQGHVIEYDEMNAADAKPAIDKIDVAFGKQFQLAEDWLDLLVNYDIKYRVGQGSAEEE